MTFNEYQQFAKQTALKHQEPSIEGLQYHALGLGEAGEAQGKVRKVIRDDDGVLTEEKRLAIADEIGDTLWVCAMMATQLNMTLEELIKRNIDKVRSRQQRGVAHGDGDYR